MKNSKNSFAVNEGALEKSQQGRFPKHFQFANVDFILYKNVFSPLFFKGSTVYIPHLPLNPGDDFLDMGCGCGIIGISAYIRYKLNKVVCSDINGHAVQNARRNVQLNNLENGISVVKSDVFKNIPHQKFDLIFWNAPYFDGTATSNSILYASMYDANYAHIKRFIIDGQRYLKPNGKIMLGFSSDKFPLEHARKLITEIGFDIDIWYQGKDEFGINQEILNIVKR